MEDWRSPVADVAAAFGGRCGGEDQPHKSVQWCLTTLLVWLVLTAALARRSRATTSAT